MRKISAVLLILLLSACGYGQDNLARWEQDLEFYSQQLIKNHIALFHTLRKDEFRIEIARIKTDIRHKNEDEILVDLMRLTRKINDGHTSFPLWGREFATFPVGLKLVGGELRVVSTSAQYKSVLGAKLISVLSDMEKFAKDLLHFIDDNKSENLVIDLRDNYGGDFFVGLKLAQFLVLADTINWRSGVYTLIDNVTFSAAMSNAAQFSQLLNSRLVGSPTGARPSGYQDMGQFTLPNSKLTVTYSKRLYHFKEDKRDALYPDVHVEPSIDDYVNGYDRALRWIMDDINENKPTTTPAKIR